MTMTGPGCGGTGRAVLLEGRWADPVTLPSTSAWGGGAVRNGTLPWPCNVPPGGRMGEWGVYSLMFEVVGPLGAIWKLFGLSGCHQE